MIVHQITGTEQDPVYKSLEADNGNRQYDFLESIAGVSLAVGRPLLSTQVLKALNFQAIACLHTSAGAFRPCEVTVGAYQPPPHYLVPDLMEDFVNQVNRQWERTDPLALATFVLWRLNYIHPFINGNGRTARAAAYFVICVAAGGLVPGRPILPELLRQNRDEYVAALQAADKSLANGALDLSVLHALLQRLLGEQVASAQPVAAAPQPGAAPPAQQP